MSNCHPVLRSMHPTGACPICVPQRVEQEPLQNDYLETLDLIAALEAASAAETELARRSLYEFLKLGWHVIEKNIPLETHWHIKELCDHTQWIFEQWAGEREDVCQNLVVNVPPGSLKSRIISVYGPAWAWMKWPHATLLCLSGTRDVALRDGEAMRELVTSAWYRETFNIEWGINPKNDARGLYKNTVGGLRQSQGFNRKVTGMRRDIILVDDPNDVKDTSVAKLKQVETAWVAARNRLNDLRIGRRLIVMQRTHESDLSGVVLKKNNWQHLVIPMELPNTVDERGKPLKCGCGRKTICKTTLGSQDPRTKPGEVLHPERNTPEVLAGELESMGSLTYAGQMNQRPAPEGGAIFLLEYWRFYDELPREPAPRELLQVAPGILSVDCTFKEGGTSRVGMVLGFPWKANLYIEWAFAKSMGLVDTCAKIQWAYDYFLDWKTGAPMIGKVLIEAKANGEAVVDTLKDEVPGLTLCQVGGDKMSRANAAVPRVEAGNVRLKRHAPWDEEFQGELASFPNGTYDDLVDALTQLIADVHQGGSDWRSLYG